MRNNISPLAKKSLLESTVKSYHFPYEFSRIYFPDCFWRNVLSLDHTILSGSIHETLFPKFLIKRIVLLFTSTCTEHLSLIFIQVNLLVIFDEYINT